MIINPKYKDYIQELSPILSDFYTQGEHVVYAERNIIKKFTLQNGLEINIKSFKVPHYINKIVYSYFRKSKARRSYEYANILQEKGIGTPQPIAYKEHKTLLGLKESYYISEQMQYDLTFRELVEIPDFPNHENILKQFTQFCFLLHENEVEFKDHTPGNTLIKRNADENYSFFLVDLNRMNFRKLLFEERMKNLSRLTPKKEMVKVMSEEYARIANYDEQKTFDTLWQYTTAFQEKYHKKQYMKQLLGLKKKENNIA